MAANVDGWKRFDDPRFELMLRYPDPTPDGRAAQVIEHAQDDGMAVHKLSAERELYVEVARFPPIGAEEEYRRHRVKLEERFGAGAVTELRASTLGSRPAQEYVFRWPEGERTAVLGTSTFTRGVNQRRGSYAGGGRVGRTVADRSR